MKFNIMVVFGDQENVIARKNNDEEDTIDLTVIIPKNKNLLEILKYDNVQQYAIDQFNAGDFGEDNVDYNTIIWLMANKYKVKKNINKIQFEPVVDVKNYLDKFPNVERYNLEISSKKFKLNNEDLRKAKSVLGSHNNVKVMIDGEENLVDLFTYNFIVNSIDEITNRVNKYNLSPVEKALFTYDLVRNKIYLKSIYDLGHKKNALNNHLNYNISSEGFAKVFEIVMNNLGVKTLLFDCRSEKNLDEPIIKKNNVSKHFRNICYINDDKYDIHGIYYFDSILGTENIVVNNNFNNYDYAFKTKNEIEELDKKNNLIYHDGCFYKITKKDFDKIMFSLLTNNKIEIDKNLLDSLEELFMFYNGQPLRRNNNNKYNFDMTSFEDLENMKNYLYPLSVDCKVVDILKNIRYADSKTINNKKDENKPKQLVKKIEDDMQ